MPRPPDSVDARAAIFASLTEKEWQAQVVKAARLLGWQVWFTWKSYHSPSGEPDLRLVRPPRYIVAELKGERGKLSKAQAEALDLLGGCPAIEVYVWRPSDWDVVVGVLQ